MKKLNVLQLVNVRWYNASAYYAVALSQALSLRGHKIIVAGDFPSPPLAEARKLGLQIYPHLFLSRTDHTSLLLNLKRLFDLVKGEKIELINAHRGEAHFYASLIKSLFKTELAVIRTRGDIRKPKKNIFNSILTHKFTDGVITSCKVLEESYQKGLNLNSSRLKNIPAGIDTAYFHPDYQSSLRKKLHIVPENLLIGMVGRLSPVKGHLFFLEAIQVISKEFPQAKFLITGEEAQLSKSFLREKAKALGVAQNIIFLGRLEDVREIISALDVGVVASVGSESVCRVALEYMAMGRPVVATRINALPEVVFEGVNGFLVQPENGLELGDAILRLLKDEKTRKYFGMKSRQLAQERFSLEIFGEETEKFYYQILNG